MPAFYFSTQYGAYVKKCSKCLETTIGCSDLERSTLLFSRHYSYKAASIDGFNGHCKKCHATRVRLNHLKSSYDLTEEEFEAFWVQQDGLCGICELPLDRTSHNSNSVCVDHIQGTLIVAGLLCVHCNAAIGLLKHKAQNFTKARDWCGRRVILLSNQEKKVG